MKVFLDSDVILDYLTARDYFLSETKVIMDMGFKKEINLYTSALIISDIHYFISKVENSKQSMIKIGKLLQFIKVTNVGEKEIMEALKSKFKDFEDGIQNFSAINSKLDIIITRNIKDFKHSDLAVLTPKEFLAKLQ